MRAQERPRIYRVAELTRRVRLKVERWGEVWVEGELSDVTRATSGHLYFTLDDGAEQAQLRGVMFRGDARFARAKMNIGERVRVLGTLSIYEPRGTFQMLARLAVTAGEGDRRAELERLKKKLAAEGLFAPERKRPLPRFPSVVGLVTSREGAAMHDVVRVASGRAPVRLVVSHCQVQGAEAPASIVQAIRRVARVPGLEVVIVTRGGGASEDLSAFNDERVARAIASCPVPVVSGVGHEVDETIADLVADLRAATPSNAAELVVPDAAALRAELDAHRRHLERALEVMVGRERLRLERLGRQLADPRRALSGVRQRFVTSSNAVERVMAKRLTHDRARLDASTRRLEDPRRALDAVQHRVAASRNQLERAMRRASAHERARLAALVTRLNRLNPRAALARDRARLATLQHRLASSRRPMVEDGRRQLAQLDAELKAAIGPPLTGARGELSELAARLGALSPLSILARGYAIAIHAPSGRALLRAEDAAPGDRLNVRLSKGRLIAEVTKVETEE